MTRARPLLALLAGRRSAWPRRARAPPRATQESIFEDEHQLLELGPAGRDARARRHRTRSAPTRVRSLVLWSPVAPRRRAASGPRASTATDPRAYPAALVGPLRRPRARRAGARAGPDPLPLDADPRVGVALQGRGNKATCKPSPEGLRRVRDRARAGATRARYARREPGRRRAAAREPLVALERAQPAGLADARSTSAGSARPSPTAASSTAALARAGDRGPARDRPRPRPDPARRDRADRPHERAARAPPDPAGRVPAQAVLPQRERAQRLRGADGRALGCRELQAPRGHGLRPPPVPARRLAAARRAAPGGRRDHDLLARRGCAACSTRRRARGGSRAGCRSTTPSSASRPTRPTASSACASRSSRRYINQSDWMAYRDRRVRAVAQYKLVDEASLSSFQSGLRFLDGRAEAGLRRLPAADLGQRARLAAARLRPGAPGRRRDAAGRQIQNRPPSGGAVHDGHHADGALAARGSSSRAVPKRAGVLAPALGRADLARGAGRAPMTAARARAALACALLVVLAGPGRLRGGGARTSRSGSRTSGCCSPSPRRRRARSPGWKRARRRRRAHPRALVEVAPGRGAMHRAAAASTPPTTDDPPLRLGDARPRGRAACAAPG